MSRKILTFFFTLSLLLALTVTAQADEPINASLAWLKTQQQADGGFTNGFSEGSDLGTTCDIILAIAAARAGHAAAWVSDEGNSPLDYLYAQVTSGAVEHARPEGQGRAGVAGYRAGPRRPSPGAIWSPNCNAAYDEATGSYGENIFEQALAMLALCKRRSAGPRRGCPVPARTTRHRWRLGALRRHGGRRWRHQHDRPGRPGAGRYGRAGRASRSVGLPAQRAERRRRLSLPEPLRLWHRHRRQLHRRRAPGPDGGR